MNKRAMTLVAAGLSVALGGAFMGRSVTAQDKGPVMRPSLAVQTVSPQKAALGKQLEANGSIAAWQEASLGTETNGLRLAELHAEAGDTVKKGQVLARFADELPRAEVAQAKAALAEAEAAAKEASANAERARAVKGAALSAQQLGQYLSAEASAQARVQAAQANVTLAELRLKHTQLLASDDGVISLRTPQATPGAVLPQGQELFRLVRQGRIEWRAEVTSSELAQIRPGQTVLVKAASGQEAKGRVRRVAPIVDSQSRNALVYVDLPASALKGGAFKPGMFAQGLFELGNHSALTVPRQAVVVRDGFSYVFLLGQEGRVHLTKVQVGARSGEVVEIIDGLKADAPVVAAGAGFLNDGDLVKRVANSAPAKP